MDGQKKGDSKVSVPESRTTPHFINISPLTGPSNMKMVQQVEGLSRLLRLSPFGFSTVGGGIAFANQPHLIKPSMRDIPTPSDSVNAI